MAVEGMQAARLVWRAVVAADKISRKDVVIAFHCQKVALCYIACHFCYSSPEDDPAHPYDILVLLCINSTSVPPT